MNFDDRGLVPAVVQDATTGEVRMVAFMNADALRLTIETGFAHFWSRARGRLWKKGEESGHVLRVVEVRFDCDEDAVLVRADPAGPTCHTGRPSCFFRTPDGTEAPPPEGAPSAIVDRVFAVIEQRRCEPGRRSYVRHLLEGGAAAVGAKIREEAGELARAIDAESDERVVAEAADAIFHLLVGLGLRGVAPARVWAELSRRSGTSGLDEKASRGARDP